MKHYKVVVDEKGNAEYLINNEPPRWAWGLLILNILAIASVFMLVLKMHNMQVMIDENFEMIDAIYQIMTIHR